MTDQTPDGSQSCPAWLRKCLLIGIGVHLLGVLAEPLRFFSRSEIRTAPEFGLLRDTMKPYSQWMYLDHGYFFFAPNPGPSHLVQCQFAPSPPATNSNVSQDAEPRKADATSEIPSSQFPDRKEQWPRLLYHRYFMLSEFYNSRFAPRHVTDELRKDQEFMARWTFDRDLYEQIQASIIKSLKHSRHVDYVELHRVERALPDSFQVLKDGWKLNDPRLLETLPETMLEPTLEPAPPSQSQSGVTIGELPNKKPAEPKP
jgi:hypothetical protein